jgi:divalent metal cation (Fe/Co/Zn/Cd) transporter
MASTNARDNKMAAIELRLRLTRIFSKILVLILVLFFGYLIMPFLQQVSFMIPFLNLPLVTVGSVTVLAVIGILLYRILSDILALLNPVSKALKILLRGFAKERVTAAKRITYDLLFMIAILIIFALILPPLSGLPGIGIFIAAALPLLALAIVVFIFWDLGKVIYSEIERLADLIADKLEKLEDKH